MDRPGLAHRLAHSARRASLSGTRPDDTRPRRERLCGCDRDSNGRRTRQPARSESRAPPRVVLANRTIIGAFTAQDFVLGTPDPRPLQPQRLPKHVRYQTALRPDDRTRRPLTLRAGVLAYSARVAGCVGRPNGTGALGRPGRRWDTWVPCRYLYAMTSLALDGAAIASTVERAIAGDELAFARIVGAYHLDLVRVAFVISGDQDLAEDAAQAAWWIAWRKLPRSGTRTGSSRGSWRSPRTRPASSSGASIGTGSSSSRSPPIPPRSRPGRRPIDHVDLANALGHLKPEDRALVAMRYAADLDSSELGPGPRYLRRRACGPACPGCSTASGRSSAMTERDAFELRFHAAVHDYAGASRRTSTRPSSPTGSPPVQPRRHGFAATLAWRGLAVPRVAWVLLLLAALLTALVAGMLVVGSQPEREAPGRGAARRPAVRLSARVDARQAGAGRPGPAAGVDGWSPMAFDRRAGRLVALAGTGRADLSRRGRSTCARTPGPGCIRTGSRRPWLGGLVYDVDSDLTIGVRLGRDRRSVGLRPRGQHLDREGPRARDGLQLALGSTTRSPASSSPGATATTHLGLELWSYDVETDTWTPIRQTKPSAIGPALRVLRLRRLRRPARRVRSGGGRGRDRRPETWLLDLRTGTWSRSGAAAPVVQRRVVGALPAIAYDEAAERTVVLGRVTSAAYDATADRWEILDEATSGISCRHYPPECRQLIGVRPGEPAARRLRGSSVAPDRGHAR